MCKKKKLTGSDRALLVCLLALLIMLCVFFISIADSLRAEKKLYQAVLPVKADTYGAAFLTQLQKLPGIRSVSPVYQIGIRLKADGCTLDTTAIGVDLDELQMQVKQAEDTILGAEPVFLPGENSLSGMTDANHQPLSESRQQQLLTHYAAYAWSYQLSDGSGEAGEADWKPCRIAGVLKSPADAVYLPSSQAKMFLTAVGHMSDRSAAEAGMTAGDVTGILLTVQGEKNYEAALAALEGIENSKNSG